MSANCHWFCVRTQPKHEHIAAAALRRFESMEVYAPQLRQRKATRRGPVWYQESLFPGYLFLRFDLAVDLPRVNHTAGVLGVVRFGGKYPELAPSLLEELKQAMGGAEVQVVGDCLQVGAQAQVLAGAFIGWKGVVLRVAAGAGRVKVLLDLLGRQTLVDLPESAVALPAAEARAFLGVPASGR